jgi:cephalosporin hydroxylase
MGKLTKIANLQKTDKGTEHFEKHGYTEVYDQYIPETGKYKLLEIGIYHGDSLRMWEEYNPELEIHALDIDENVLSYIQQPNPYHIYLGSQVDPVIIDKIGTKAGKLDFIIDDGSHICDHIVTSFRLLWPYLKSGGYYFIEDLHAPHAVREETIKLITSWLDGRHDFMILSNDAKLLTIKKK